MEKRVKVIVYRVGQDPVVEEIVNDLKSMQEIVGGYIGGHFFGLNDVQIICHDEGKLEGLPPNRFVPAIGDVIVGNFFVSRHSRSGNTVSTTEKDLAFCKEHILPLDSPEAQKFLMSLGGVGEVMASWFGQKPKGAA